MDFALKKTADVTVFSNFLQIGTRFYRFFYIKKQLILQLVHNFLWSGTLF